ncbi:pentatricopeptide repeat-containing protein-like [Iris pallida]|uniref:Pentatricopeptide repeat-containing protein-like n=1 Tax=Iris pallida TaxID=29817 RepID=A0AAX6FLT4_IRIPA|nr:pentatricopeptide repeat-containing protein-like [Iris pallida]
MLLSHSQCLQFSLPSLLKSCAALEEGLQIHAQILKTAHFQLDPYISNALLRMYAQLGHLARARRVFDTTPPPTRDAISWNSLISACVSAGHIEPALTLFHQMPEKDVVSFNSVIDGLMKSSTGSNGCDAASDLFRSMPAAAVRRDVVTWTVMISGYVANGRPEEALDTFRTMLASGVRPDAAAVVNVLSAVADLGLAQQGKWVHAYLRRRTDVELNSELLGSALIDMYAKCGLIHDARRVFASVRYKRRIGDWNSMIGGFALHGLGREALEVFEEMERLAIDPGEITFLGVLNACSHSGLVEEGRYYFELMRGKLQIEPRVQHYGCLIDLLGRAGLIEEATRVVAEMGPVQPDAMVWKSLLSSCVRHGDWVTGERAAVNAIGSAPQDSSSYVLLSNMYARLGRWQDVDRVRALMRARGVRKIPGCSALTIDGKVHEFLVGKDVDSGGRRDVILSKLEEVICRLKSEGYEPDLSQVLVDVEESEKEGLLSVHSEKMAIAFGLVNVEKGSNAAPIHIVKNLRVCSDCHSFTELVSRVYKQEIVLRDQNRFHHFKGGSCSCNGYW